MSRIGDAKPSQRPRVSATTSSDAATTPPFTAREDAVSLLRLAGLDGQMGRFRQSMAALLEPLDRLRLAALAGLVEEDRFRGLTQESGEAVAERRRRLLIDQGMHAELANALKRDEKA